MIASLTGNVAEVTPTAALIDVGGVGYLVYAPVPVLASLSTGDRVRLLTHLVVREDSMTLYGFRSADQRDTFQALIGVTGVGPKLAAAVLSSLDPAALRQAVAVGDVDVLTGVPGVGRRGAQRMVLELRDRLGVAAGDQAVPGASLAEVRAALAGLGYAPAELRGVVEAVATPGATVESMVRGALKALAGAKTPAPAKTAPAVTKTTASAKTPAPVKTPAPARTPAPVRTPAPAKTREPV